MQRVTNKILIFLIIGSTVLLPLMVPEIQAQQTVAPQTQAVQARAVTIKELKSRHIAIESKQKVLFVGRILKIPGNREVCLLGRSSVRSEGGENGHDQAKS